MSRTPTENDVIVLARHEANPEWWPRVSARVVEADDGCLRWVGAVGRDGYGTAHTPRAAVGVKGIMVKTHRAALVINLGRPLGAGMTASHICHDQALGAGLCTPGRCIHRRCMRTEHLIEEPMGDNARAGGAYTWQKQAITECPRGHDLTNPVNLRPRQQWRSCQICANQRSVLQTAAARTLGISRDDFLAQYGHARPVAESIVGPGAADIAAEAEARFHARRTIEAGR